MRVLILSVSAITVSGVLALCAAGPVAAWPFGNKPATPQPVAGQNATGAAASDGLPAFSKATPQQIEAELRADPFSQAAFFARQFEHDATNAKLGLYLSNAQRALGRYDEAADTAHTVLLFAPDNTDVLLAAARAHIAGNNGFYAIDLLKHFNTLKANDWQAWSLLGIAYDQTKRPDDAQAAWQTALKLSPNNPAVLTNMAMAHTAAGDFAGAEPLMRTAVAQKGATLQERQDLALVLGLEGKMPEAEKLLRDDLPPAVVDANLAWLQNSLQSHAATAAAPAPSPVAATPVAAAPSRSWDGLKATGG